MVGTLSPSLELVGQEVHVAKTCDWHLKWGQSVVLSLYPEVSVLTLHS